MSSFDPRTAASVIPYSLANFLTYVIWAVSQISSGPISELKKYFATRYEVSYLVAPEILVSD